MRLIRPLPFVLTIAMLVALRPLDAQRPIVYRPAALTAQWSAPKRSTVAATAASTDASLVTSHSTNAAEDPRSPATCSSTSRRRAASITRPPPATTACAQASPMPVAPPVRKATLPLKSGTSATQAADDAGVEASCGVFE